MRIFNICLPCNHILHCLLIKFAFNQWNADCQAPESQITVILKGWLFSGARLSLYCPHDKYPHSETYRPVSRRNFAPLFTICPILYEVINITGGIYVRKINRWRIREGEYIRLLNITGQEDLHFDTANPYNARQFTRRAGIHTRRWNYDNYLQIL